MLGRSHALGWVKEWSPFLANRQISGPKPAERSNPKQLPVWQITDSPRNRGSRISTKDLHSGRDAESWRVEVPTPGHSFTHRYTSPKPPLRHPLPIFYISTN